MAKAVTLRPSTTAATRKLHAIFTTCNETYGEAMKQINAMNVDELLAIKAKVEAAISSRVEQERKRLTASLQRLEAIAGEPAQISRGPRGQDPAHRRTLPPKYRNPKNPKQTWAGRGLKPRWLVAALKDGKKKLSDFAIDRDRK